MPPDVRDENDAFVAEVFRRQLINGFVGREIEIGGHQFVIKEPIGRGGQGIVFSATHRRTSAKYALKMLWRDDAASIARSWREAEIGALQHPHVVRVFETKEHDGHVWLLLELVEGQSLFDLLRKGPLPKDRVARLGAHCADALAFLHDKGVVHRDIKPSNIIIENAGSAIEKAKITDLGLAYLATAEPLTGEYAPGTLSYMAPELNSKGQATPQSDIFSLGAVLFEVLTGQQLLGRNGKAALASTSLPADMARIIACCIQVDPLCRYRSARFLMEDLDAVADGHMPRHAPSLPISRRSAGTWMLTVGLSALAANLFVAIGWSGHYGETTKQMANQAIAAQIFGQGKPESHVTKASVAAENSKPSPPAAVAKPTIDPPRKTEKIVLPISLWGHQENLKTHTDTWSTGKLGVEGMEILAFNIRRHSSNQVRSESLKRDVDASGRLRAIELSAVIHSGPKVGGVRGRLLGEVELEVAPVQN